MRSEKKLFQKTNFSASCMILAGAVLLICPATALPMTAFGTAKLARLNALNISQRKFSRSFSLTWKFR